MVRVEMRTDEQINIIGVQAKLCKLLQHIVLHDRHWHSRWWLHLTGQTAINQNVGAVAGLHEITDEREVSLRDARYLHQVEPLRSSTVCVHMMILSFWSKYSMCLVCMRTKREAKKASPSLFPRRVVKRSREETNEKRALILGKALQCTGVHLFLEGRGDLFQRSTSFGQKNALNAPVAWFGLTLYQLRTYHALDQTVHGRSLQIEEFLQFHLGFPLLSPELLEHQPLR